MVIVVSWQSVINDLFQNNDKVVNEVFVVLWLGFDFFQEVVEGASHYTWILIAKCLFHFLIDKFNWNRFIEFIQDHHTLLSYHFMLVVQQS